MSISVSGRSARRPRRHQEIPSGRAERLDDLAHRDLVAAGDLHQLAELGRAAHRLGKARPGGQRAKHRAGDLAMLGQQLVEDLAAVRGERAAKPAERLVVRKLQLDRAARGRAAAIDQSRFSTCCISGSWSARRTSRSS